MIIARNDGVSFFANSFNESISLKLSKKAQVEALEALRKSHSGDFILVQRSENELSVSFASEKCYSLGGAALSYFQNFESFVWVERLGDKNDFIFVCAENRKIIAELVVRDCDIAPYLLSNALGGEPRKKIITSSEIPEFVIKYFRENSEENLLDELIIVKETPVFDALPVSHSLAYRPYDIVYSGLQNRNSAPINKFIIFGLIACGLIWLLVSDSTDEETQEAIQIVDPYEGFKPLINGPDASTAISNIYKILNRIEPNYLWKFKSCTYTAGMPLLCELEPSIASRTADLNRLTKLAGHGAQVNLKNSNAVFVVPIDATNKNRPYAITNHRVLVEVLYDRLLSSGEASQIHLMTASHDSLWTTQIFSFGKSNTGLYNLPLVAESVNGLPVNVESVKVTREENSYSIEYTLISFGGK